MIHCLLLLLCAIVINATHFNGGTIRWVPVDPYDNSSSITITIIQSYSWAYPIIVCTTDVPASTPTRAGSNLTCIGSCSTDGGYSSTPVNTLTDCNSASLPLQMMTSERSVNVTVSSGAYFYLAYQGSNWRPLNSPTQLNALWSIVSFIDLQLRPDGFINTPPTASVFSPQYVIVNRATQIPIIVSDVNKGDDVRCRWSSSSTSSSIDECANVCYPASVPSGTTLSNCTLSFQGPIVNISYAVAIQVEDFIDTTSVTPMSSVPVQFLISVIPEPICSDAPVIIPLTGCLEVTVGVLISIDIFVLNLCDPNDTGIIDMVVTSNTNDVQISNLTNSLTNTSLSYKTITWTPQANEIGPQELCMIAYTSDFVQSTQYCVTFIVITSSAHCPTTTTTTTTSTDSTTTGTTTTTTTTSTDSTTTGTTTTTTTTSTDSTATTTTTTSTDSTTTGTTTTTTTTSTDSTTTTTTTTSTDSTTTGTTTTAVTEAQTSTSAPGKDTNWGLIAGILSLILLLVLCSLCCFYRLLWSPTARRRRRQQEEQRNEDQERYRHLDSTTESISQTTTAHANESSHIEVPRKNYQVYDIFSKENSANKISSTTDNQESILISIYNSTNGSRCNRVGTNNTKESFKMGSARMRPRTNQAINRDIPLTRSITMAGSSASEVRNFKATNENFIMNHQSNDQIDVRAFSTPPFNIGGLSVPQSRLETTSEIGQSRHPNDSSFNSNDCARTYLFGSEHNFGIPGEQEQP